MNTPLIDQMEAVSTLLAEEGPIRSEKSIRQRLDGHGYEPFNPHRAIMWLRALGIVSKHGLHAYTFHSKLRFPDEHLRTATYETAINARQDLADTLRELADWVEESIGEPDEEEWA
ncbi:hypothetical protein [Bifidobacterium castoris]|uniref:Uncharacterized protein n=1 Tax=Bifidobacterium castoris TaxID=2306972 RepID=A0A430F7L7_9BIFI|nr:hypothetical protein [Bifidobacterium castoris]RSX48919.1 hypothetical protein D2E22_1057 [Bifidobacterium castoris]